MDVVRAHRPRPRAQKEQLTAHSQMHPEPPPVRRVHRDLLAVPAQRGDPSPRQQRMTRRRPIDNVTT
jgi:hypothetical protein